MKSFFPNSMAILDRPLGGGDSVAILTRTKNREWLLPRAFASMLEQTHQNWHLYLTNDGGNQASIEALVERWSSAFAGRITLLHHEHSKGMAEASNAGLRKAHEDFIVVHDDDDSWHPNFLARTVAFLNEEPNAQFAAVATHWYIVEEVFEGERAIERGRSHSKVHEEVFDMTMLLGANRTPPICMLVRKSVMDQIGEFNKYMKCYDDWDSYIRILAVGDIGVIPEPLANYHLRPATGTSAGIYGNAVVAGISTHRRFELMYRNSLARATLQKEPHLLGLFNLLLRQVNEAKEFEHNAAQSTLQAMERMHQDLALRIMKVEKAAGDGPALAAPMAKPAINASPIKGQSVPLSDEMAGLATDDVLAALCQGKRVLHVGCASGWPHADTSTSLHAKLGPVCAQLDGLDPNVDALMAMSANAPGLLCTDFTDLTQSYDTVVVSGMLETVAEPGAFLRQLAGLATNSLLLVVHNAAECLPQTSSYRAETATFTEASQPDRATWFTPFTFRQALANTAGLKLEQMWRLSGGSLLALASPAAAQMAA
jgi:glycosyltransferase involved in cell wall biosynthesis/2-polyprenyl-3-methyl-5-hydroxy-6-metoxy-1,4-benzoquinol methylase